MKPKPGAWSAQQKTYCMRLFRAGRTDRNVADEMSKKFLREFSVHSIRSYRGRIERAKLLPLGVAGSSKEIQMPRKKKRQRWDRKAERRLIELHYAGYPPRRIARMLFREGLRAANHPGAVGDRLSLLRRLKKIKPENGPQAPLPLPLPPVKSPVRVKPPVIQASNSNIVELTPRIGNKETFTVGNNTFVEILNLCNRSRFEVVPD